MRQSSELIMLMVNLVNSFNLHKAKQDINTLQTEVDDMTEKYEEVKNENQRFRIEIDTLVQDADTLENEINDLSDQLGRALSYNE